MTAETAKPNERKAPAGWRRGYAADCKSPPDFSENNTLSNLGYPDKDGTKDELGNRSDRVNPIENWAPTPADLEFRKERAVCLVQAIGDAHPDDACQIMTAALLEMSPNGPQSAVFLSAEDEANWWASIATPPQLAAVLSSALKALGGKTALHLDMRKRLFLKLWRSFPAADKARFVAYAKAGQ